MSFSILHLSDLHRGSPDSVDNPWLLESLARDFDSYTTQDPPLPLPNLCIVSGDLIFGARPGDVGATAEISRQYEQAEQFLSDLTDRFFRGDHSRVVLLPGNHDVSFPTVMDSLQRIDIPSEASHRQELAQELFAPGSRLRWSWNDMSYYRIADYDRYERRIDHFTALYDRFYQNTRSFPISQARQYCVFDFPELGFCVVALSSCYDNDPLRPSGAFCPTALANACREVRDYRRAGWLVAAAWHHSLTTDGGQNDFLPSSFIQLLIDAGVSLGFHGHQHFSDCFDERYRLGPSPRKMTIISAGTLCADTRHLRPGVPRAFNVVELDQTVLKGRVHQRQMINFQFSAPLWGPGHYSATNASFVDFQVCEPVARRPANLDQQLALDNIDRLVGSGDFERALVELREFVDVPLARPFLVKTLQALGDPRKTIEVLFPPTTSAEAILLGGAVCEAGNRQEAEAFLALNYVRKSNDPSVGEIVRRVKQRWGL